MFFLGHQIRKTVLAAAVSISAVGATFALATPALASTSGSLVSATNASRSGAGLAALQESSQLDAVAQGWADKLAGTQVLSHNPNLASQITGWSTIGENVGMGADIPSLEQAFMASPAHKANILSAAFTQVGVGTASSIDPGCKCAVLWVVVDFRRPTTVAPAPAPVKKTPVKASPVTPAPAKSTPAAAKPVPVVVPTHAPVAVAPTATPVAVVKPAVVKPAAVALDSPAALQSQIAHVDPASGAGADPVSTVLDFASVLAAIS